MKDSARAPGFSGRLVGLPKCLLHARLAVASTLRASISSPVIGMQAIHHVHTCRFLLFSAWLICGLTYCVLCGVRTRVVSFCFGCGSPSSPSSPSSSPSSSYILRTHLVELLAPFPRYPGTFSRCSSSSASSISKSTSSGRTEAVFTFRRSAKKRFRFGGVGKEW